MQQQPSVEVEFSEKELRELYDGWGEFREESESASSEEPFEESQVLSEEPIQIEEHSQEPSNSSLTKVCYGGFPDTPLPTNYLIEPEKSPKKLVIERRRSWVDPCALANDYYNSLLEKENRCSYFSGELPWPYETYSERTIIDEVISMLFGVETEVFKYEKEFKLAKKLQVMHLTPSCLERTLEFYMNLGTNLFKIEENARLLFNSTCITHKHFGEACKDYIKEVRRELISVKEEFCAQAGVVTQESIGKLPQETLTLVSLRNRLEKHTESSELVISIINKALVTSSEFNEAYKASYLLSSIFALINENHELTDFQNTSLLARLFTKTLEAYIGFLSSWMSFGSLSSKDFFISEKKKTYNSTFEKWERSYNVVQESLKSSKVDCIPVFLVEVSGKILNAGKTMAVIKQIEEQLLDKIIQPPSALMQNFEHIVSSKLRQLTAHCFSQEPPATLLQVNTVGWQPKSYYYMAPPSQFTKEFQFIDSNAPFHLFSPVDCELPNYFVEVHQEQAPPLPLQNHWISFQSVVDEAICEPVVQLHYETSEYLVHLLKNYFRLDKHFEALRGILFLENGNAMYQFVKFLLKKLEKGERIENNYEVTSMFGESIKAVGDKDITDNFKIEFGAEVQDPNSIEALSHIRINFEPSAPLDLVFDPLTIKSYQVIFHRLLQIKRAIYCVSSFKWRRKAHPFLLNKMIGLQKELLHFMSCFEEYIMQHSLFSQSHKFKATLETAQTVEDIRKAHQLYINKATEKCLLGPKAHSLNEAITGVFKCCVHFSNLEKQVYNFEDSKSELLQLDSTIHRIKDSFQTANKIVLKVLTKLANSGFNFHCKFYLDLGAFYSVNFNKFYLED